MNRVDESCSAGLLSFAQQCHKGDFHKSVWWDSIFKVCNYVLIDRPNLVAILSEVANELAGRRYKKLLRWVSGQYRVLSVQPTTVTSEENGILYTVSIVFFMLSPTSEQVTDSIHENDVSCTTTNRKPTATEGCRRREEMIRNYSAVPQKNVIGHLMHHVDRLKRRMCVVRW